MSGARGRVGGTLRTRAGARLELRLGWGQGSDWVRGKPDAARAVRYVPCSPLSSPPAAVRGRGRGRGRG